MQNAIKNTQKGSIRLRVFLSEQLRVRFELQDTGFGLGKYELAEIRKQLNEIQLTRDLEDSPEEHSDEMLQSGSFKGNSSIKQFQTLMQHGGKNSSPRSPHKPCMLGFGLRLSQLFVKILSDDSALRIDSEKGRGTVVSFYINNLQRSIKAIKLANSSNNQMQQIRQVEFQSKTPTSQQIDELKGRLR